MNIEKLCEEFHEKVGKEKTVKISVTEIRKENTDKDYKPAIFEFKNNRPNLPFTKTLKNKNIIYKYTGSLTSNAK